MPQHRRRAVLVRQGLRRYRADPRNSRFYTPLMGSFIAMLVQLFFCYRVVVLRRVAWPLAVLIALISMAQCAGGMGSGILSCITADVHDAKRTALVYMWLIGGVASGVLIAATMTALLFHATSPRDAAKNIVRLVIETNTLSAIVTIVGFVLFFGVPNTSYFVCPTMILPGYTPTRCSSRSTGALSRTSLWLIPTCRC
ncbi:hypothetical protein B0H10DRAFT_2012769 [Mycena sp. CBHHK59/15]|nr:hypothetical protein B0H10DRAFT_2012769 [Mycena sp. CBHHK59/15]